MAGLSVLIADDHQLVRDTVAHYLAAEGDVAVTLADTLPDALAAIGRAGGFDIVLLPRGGSICRWDISRAIRPSPPRRWPA